MNKEQWLSLVDRLNKPNEKKQRKISAIVAEREKELQRETTFKPSINTKSRVLAQQFSGLNERIGHFLEDKKRKIEKKREQLAEEEMKDVTFKPSLEKRSERFAKQRDVETLMQWVSMLLYLFIIV
jgi:hypothetical protein